MTRKTDSPEVWAEHIVTKDDAIKYALCIDEAVTDTEGLAALDEAMMVLEVRADDPEPYTIMRAAIALRLEDLEAR